MENSKSPEITENQEREWRGVIYDAELLAKSLEAEGRVSQAEVIRRVIDLIR